MSFVIGRKEIKPQSCTVGRKKEEQTDGKKTNGQQGRLMDEKKSRRDVINENNN